jgi:ADP-ribose pyrophosphatase YjhB (NUDIX family)
MDLKQSSPDIGDSFLHCPRCIRPEPEIREGREMRCSACGLRFFFNVAAACGAFIFIGERIVLCVRGHDPGKGLLDVPGGFIEFDETLEDGLIREIREELGIEVSSLSYLTSAPNNYEFANVPYRTADVFYICEALNPESLHAADDVAEIILVKPEDVNPVQFAFESTRRAFHALLDQRRI